MAARRGLGKVKHMDTQYLWIQERINNNDFTLSKVPGANNPADLLTKHLPKEAVVRHMATLGMEVRDDRSAIAPLLGAFRLKGCGALSSLSARLRPQPRRGVTGIDSGTTSDTATPVFNGRVRGGVREHNDCSISSNYPSCHVTHLCGA